MGQPRNLLRAKCPGTSVFHVPSCYNNRRFRASIILCLLLSLIDKLGRFLCQ
jgi:hypothetical protein